MTTEPTPERELRDILATLHRMEDDAPATIRAYLVEKRQQWHNKPEATPDRDSTLAYLDMEIAELDYAAPADDAADNPAADPAPVTAGVMTSQEAIENHPAPAPHPEPATFNAVKYVWEAEGMAQDRLSDYERRGVITPKEALALACSHYYDTAAAAGHESANHVGQKDKRKGQYREFRTSLKLSNIPRGKVKTMPLFEKFAARALAKCQADDARRNRKN